MERTQQLQRALAVHRQQIIERAVHHQHVEVRGQSAGQLLEEIARIERPVHRFDYGERGATLPGQPAIETTARLLTHRAAGHAVTSIRFMTTWAFIGTGKHGSALRPQGVEVELPERAEPEPAGSFSHEAEEGLQATLVEPREEFRVANQDHREHTAVAAVLPLDSPGGGNQLGSGTLIEIGLPSMSSEGVIRQTAQQTALVGWIGAAALGMVLALPGQGIQPVQNDSVDPVQCHEMPQAPVFAVDRDLDECAVLVRAADVIPVRSPRDDFARCAVVVEADESSPNTGTLNTDVSMGIPLSTSASAMARDGFIDQLAARNAMHWYIGLHWTQDLFEPGFALADDLLEGVGRQARQIILGVVLREVPVHVPGVVVRGVDVQLDVVTGYDRSLQLTSNLTAVEIVAPGLGGVTLEPHDLGDIGHDLSASSRTGRIASACDRSSRPSTAAAIHARCRGSRSPM